MRCQVFSSPLKVEKQGGQGYSKSGRHLSNVLETQIALAALDRSHEGSVDPAFVGKGFLRIAPLSPQISYVLPQSPQEQTCICVFHASECLRYAVVASTAFT